MGGLRGKPALSGQAFKLVIPGDPTVRTGGYIYNARVVDELRRRGWRIEIVSLDVGYPSPDDAMRARTAATFAAFPDGDLVVVDGLALGAMPEIAAEHGKRLRLVALVHHPLAFEAGLAEDTAASLMASEREALAHVRNVIVTSPVTRDALVTSFDVARDRVAVALPGTDPAPLARGSGTGTPTLLAVGSIIPRKAFPDLVAALAPLAALPWQLRIAGNDVRDAVAAADLRRQIAAFDLGSRITLTGELEPDTLATEYDRADLFASASRYEGFGMAIAEALARGLPIVAVDGGAVGAWLDREAALLVPVDEPTALHESLRQVLTDNECLARLQKGARRARAHLPGWSDAADRFAAALAPL